MLSSYEFECWLSRYKLMLDTTGSDTVHYSYDRRGQLVSFSLNGTPYFYTRNGQGDITGLIDASGVEVVKYTYDSWGKPVSIIGSLALTIGVKNPYRYRGYRYDHESGLYYLQSRYYDPSIKRFISADIFVSTGQGFSGNNVYAYCGNQPINRSDSGGMFWETAFDVVSLGFSIWEVVQNPKDPWAWAGLVGDAIDLLPIVTGVGETTRAIKTANNLAETAENAVDAIKGASEVITVPQKVIGHYPEYVELSTKLNTQPFSVPDNIWNKMTSAEQWAANQKFLDRAISKGTEFNLATSIDKVRPGSYLQKEIMYLMSQGYKLSSDATKLIR